MSSSVLARVGVEDAVVLGWRTLAQADLDVERPVTPFDLPLPKEVGFYLAYPKSRAR